MKLACVDRVDYILRVMERYLAAAIQMNSGPDVGANLTVASELVADAATEGATLVALPENFPFLGPDDQKSRMASEIERLTRSFLNEVAARHQVTVLGGGFPVPAEAGKVFNTAVLIDPSGEELASY